MNKTSLTLLSSCAFFISQASFAMNESEAHDRASKIADAVENAKKYELDLDIAKPNEEEKERYKDTAKTGRDRGQAELEALLDRERAKHGIEEPREDTEAKGVIHKGKLIVAISSSMPDELVRSLIIQLAGKPEAVIVLRGFIGGANTVKPTMQWLGKLRRITPSKRDSSLYNVKTIVDPLLYRDLGITEVPAVAWLDGVEELSHCDEEDYNAAVVAYGATRVSYALEKAKEAGASIPETLISKFKPIGWQEK